MSHPTSGLWLPEFDRGAGDEYHHHAATGRRHADFVIQADHCIGLQAAGALADFVGGLDARFFQGAFQGLRTAAEKVAKAGEDVAYHVDALHRFGADYIQVGRDFAPFDSASGGEDHCVLLSVVGTCPDPKERDGNKPALSPPVTCGPPKCGYFHWNVVTAY